jgi:thiamine kinase-like enzyme
MNQHAVPSGIQMVAQTLLTQLGWDTVNSINPLAGGRNNRVYRVASPHGSAILKQYHQGEGTIRDRFASELAWYRYCQSLKIDAVPQFWIADHANRCTLISEIPGRKLVAGEVTADHVRQAAAFFLKLNSDRTAALAANLPAAADACFCIDDFLTQVEVRLQRLRTISVVDAVTTELQSWLTESLFPQWEVAKATIEKAFDREQRQAVRSEQERCVSPSDFGFHNAVLKENGDLVFLDFEYAGWDDPAKMICDFFWQVDVPAPKETLLLFLDTTESFDETLRERVRRLFAVIGIKWCTIVLNEFLNDGKARREFAATNPVNESTCHKQLKIARRILDDVKKHREQELF